MTQEQKELLLRDLCARLSSMVRVKVDDEYMEGIYVLRGYESGLFVVEGNHYDIDEVTPYLRLLGSMTEGEKNELLQLMGHGTDIERIDFYISHHFDYRGLIEKGLALEAPEDMYKN